MEKNINKLLPTILVVSLILDGIMFFGGYKYAQAKTTSAKGSGNYQAAGANGNFRQGGAGGTRGARAGAGMMGGFVSGDILSKDVTSLTVKMRDGSSKIILISGTTKVMKSVAGTTDDLQVGSTVMVTGDTNTDGSVTAQSLQLRDALPTTTPATK